MVSQAIRPSNAYWSGQNAPPRPVATFSSPSIQPSVESPVPLGNQQQAAALFHQQQRQIKQQAAAIQQQQQQLQQMQMQLQTMGGNALLDVKNSITPYQLNVCKMVCAGVCARPELLSTKELEFLKDFVRDMSSIVEDPSHRITADVLRSLDVDSMIKSSGSSPCAVNTYVSGISSPLSQSISKPCPFSMTTVPSESSQGASRSESRASTPTSFSLDIGSIMSALDIPPSSASLWQSEAVKITTIEPMVSQMKPPTPPMEYIAPMNCHDAEAQNGCSLSDDEDDKSKANVDPRKYKTRLCRNWMKEGKCSYEHTCCFAHGENELRNSAANMSVLSSLGYFSSKSEVCAESAPLFPAFSCQKQVRRNNKHQ